MISYKIPKLFHTGLPILVSFNLCKLKAVNNSTYFVLFQNSHFDTNVKCSGRNIPLTALSNKFPSTGQLLIDLMYGRYLSLTHLSQIKNLAGVKIAFYL